MASKEEERLDHAAYEEEEEGEEEDDEDDADESDDEYDDDDDDDGGTDRSLSISQLLVLNKKMMVGDDDGAEKTGKRKKGDKKERKKKRKKKSSKEKPRKSKQEKSRESITTAEKPPGNGKVGTGPQRAGVTSSIMVDEVSSESEGDDESAHAEPRDPMNAGVVAVEGEADEEDEELRRLLEEEEALLREAEELKAEIARCESSENVRGGGGDAAQAKEEDSTVAAGSTEPTDGRAKDDAPSAISVELKEPQRRLVRAGSLLLDEVSSEEEDEEEDDTPQMRSVLLAQAQSNAMRDTRGAGKQDAPRPASAGPAPLPQVARGFSLQIDDVSSSSEEEDDEDEEDKTDARLLGLQAQAKAADKTPSRSASVPPKMTGGLVADEISSDEDDSDEEAEGSSLAPRSKSTSCELVKGDRRDVIETTKRLEWDDDTNELVDELWNGASRFDAVLKEVLGELASPWVCKGRVEWENEWKEEYLNDDYKSTPFTIRPETYFKKKKKKHGKDKLKAPKKRKEKSKRRKQCVATDDEIAKLVDLARTDSAKLDVGDTMKVLQDLGGDHTDIDLALLARSDGDNATGFLDEQGRTALAELEQSGSTYDVPQDLMLGGSEVDELRGSLEHKISMTPTDNEKKIARKLNRLSFTYAAVGLSRGEAKRRTLNVLEELRKFDHE